MAGREQPRPLTHARAYAFATRTRPYSSASRNTASQSMSSSSTVCHDPDAPLVTPGRYGYVHWVLYNIPGSATGLAEGSGDHTQGVSDFGKPGYGGPMPPEGHGVHNYFFWLLALDAELDLEPGLGMWDLLERIEPNVIGMNRLVGTYQRG